MMKKLQEGGGWSWGMEVDGCFFVKFKDQSEPIKSLFQLSENLGCKY